MSRKKNNEFEKFVNQLKVLDKSEFSMNNKSSVEANIDLLFIAYANILKGLQTAQSGADQTVEFFENKMLSKFPSEDEIVALHELSSRLCTNLGDYASKIQAQYSEADGPEELVKFVYEKIEPCHKYVLDFHMAINPAKENPIKAKIEFLAKLKAKSKSKSSDYTENPDEQNKAYGKLERYIDSYDAKISRVEKSFPIKVFKARLENFLETKGKDPKVFEAVIKHRFGKVYTSTWVAKLCEQNASELMQACELYEKNGKKAIELRGVRHIYDSLVKEYGLNKVFDAKRLKSTASEASSKTHADVLSLVEKLNNEFAALPEEKFSKKHPKPKADCYSVKFKLSVISFFELQDKINKNAGEHSEIAKLAQGAINRMVDSYEKLSGKDKKQADLFLKENLRKFSALTQKYSLTIREDSLFVKKIKLIEKSETHADEINTYQAFQNMFSLDSKNYAPLSKREAALKKYYFPQDNWSRINPLHYIAFAIALTKENSDEKVNDFYSDSSSTSEYPVIRALTRASEVVVRKLLEIAFVPARILADLAALPVDLALTSAQDVYRAASAAKGIVAKWIGAELKPLFEVASAIKGSFMNFFAKLKDLPAAFVGPKLKNEDLNAAFSSAFSSSPDNFHNSVGDIYNSLGGTLPRKEQIISNQTSILNEPKDSNLNQYTTDDASQYITLLTRIVGSDCADYLNNPETFIANLYQEEKLNEYLGKLEKLPVSEKSIAFEKLHKQFEQQLIVVKKNETGCANLPGLTS